MFVPTESFCLLSPKRIIWLKTKSCVTNWHTLQTLHLRSLFSYIHKHQYVNIYQYSKADEHTGGEETRLQWGRERRVRRNLLEAPAAIATVHLASVQQQGRTHHLTGAVCLVLRVYLHPPVVHPVHHLTTKAMSYELVCQSDFLVLGFQDSEEWMAIIRLLSTIVTISIISSFCNKWEDDRLLLFCAHWLRLVLCMGMVIGEVYGLMQHHFLLYPAKKNILVQVVQRSSMTALTCLIDSR